VKNNKELSRSGHSASASRMSLQISINICITDCIKTEIHEFQWSWRPRHMFS